MPTPVLKLLAAASAETPDAELLGRFVTHRDEPAFAELVRRHGPAVYRVCRRLVGPSSADDAFQATFLVLACRARAVRKAASVGSWLVGVAGRVARQMRRTEGRGQRTEDRARTEAGRGVDSLTSELCLLTSELAAVLDDELTRLPDHLRDPVVLCLLHGRTQEEAAAELGGSVRTLRRRLDRAKAVLRARLERRGVVPAVAAGLAAGVGSPAVAVPPELARRTVACVFEFLAGGAVTPAAVVAKGVVMGTAKLKAAGLASAAAVVLTGLGIGLAGDPPAQPPTEPLAPPAVFQPPATPAPVADPLTVPPAVPVRAVSHRTANFVVYATTETQARVLASEAEYWRKELAKRWLGVELADWKDPCVIRFQHSNSGVGGATAFTYESGGKTGVKTAEMQLTGPFLTALESALPHEVMHTVLATHFGRPLPRWADEGIALTAEPAAVQANHDTLCRKLLGEGRGIRLRLLCKMTDYPRDTMVTYAQGYSVVRFLLTRQGNVKGDRMPSVAAATNQPIDARKVDLKDDPSGVQVVLFDPANPHKCLTAFLWVGGNGNTAESWDRAAKEVYGFESVDALEAAWLEWLKKPESRLAPPVAPAGPVEPKDEKRELIPPTKVPGGDPKADPLLGPETIPPTRMP